MNFIPLLLAVVIVLPVVGVMVWVCFVVDRTDDEWSSPVGFDGMLFEDSTPLSGPSAG